jgi:hypothetical protein
MWLITRIVILTRTISISTSIILSRKVWFYHAKSDFITQSMILSSMSVILTLTNVIPKISGLCYYSDHACNAGTLRVNLAPWVWFWHSAWDLNSHACEFDTLRIKILYNNINLSSRHMPATVWKTITRMRVESTHCAALLPYHTARRFNTFTWRFNTHACRFITHECSKSILNTT